jgi:hypothetical protein
MVGRPVHQGALLANPQSISQGGTESRLRAAIREAGEPGKTSKSYVLWNPYRKPTQVD